jgi:alkanesulfonate monooxygenase SsuD/methylene tetrahydromethanopterin reductase-like flavin-dependent oxidoreductase (luciferase family)
MHASNRVTEDNLEEVFTYHAPTPDQVQRYAEVREYAVAFGRAILRCVPDCADRSAALRELRSARMWANAAIALEEVTT